MKEYIDREALIAEYDRVHQGPAGGARKLMVDDPAADVVAVVRCKDCKHLMFSDCYGECSKAYLGIVSPWDFCSRGERKEQE
jgi:hypothetical protein